MNDESRTINRSSVATRRLVLTPLYPLILLFVFFSTSCAVTGEKRTIPAEVESAIAEIGDDIAAERYEKIYNEAADLWRQDASLEQSISAFKTVREKLGNVDSRTIQSATAQENSGGPLKGNAYIVTYRTKFQKAEGMETFTLVQRDGRWALARYLVNSTALK